MMVAMFPLNAPACLFVVKVVFIAWGRPGLVSPFSDRSLLSHMKAIEIHTCAQQMCVKCWTRFWPYFYKWLLSRSLHCLSEPCFVRKIKPWRYLKWLLVVVPFLGGGREASVRVLLGSCLECCAFFGDKFSHSLSHVLSDKVWLRYLIAFKSNSSWLPKYPVSFMIYEHVWRRMSCISNQLLRCSERSSYYCYYVMHSC